MVDLAQQIKIMKVQLTCRVNNREFGLGVFFKKESILSCYNYAFYIKLLWFKLGFRIAYGNKYK